MNLDERLQKDLSPDIYCLVHNKIVNLEQENKELKEKLDKYENPKDTTLFAIWCTEKVKEDNKRLKEKYINAVSDYETTMSENKQLKNRWNMLKKYLQEEYEALDKRINPPLGCAMGEINRIKDKMQELEQGSDSDVED